MDNLKTIKENSKDLYDNLITFDCKVSYNGKTLYEGKYDENYKYGTNIDKSCVVLEFSIGDKKYICLEEANENINTLKECITVFDDIFTNPKLYNKAINLSYKLPMFCICEDNEIIKKGEAITKIYENLNI